MSKEVIDYKIGDTVILKVSPMWPDGEYRITGVSNFRNGVCVRKEEESKELPTNNIKHIEITLD